MRAPRACSARRHVLLSGVCCCVTAFGPTVAPGANPLAFARMRRVPTTVAARVRRVGVGNQLLLHIKNHFIYLFFRIRWIGAGAPARGPGLAPRRRAEGVCMRAREKPRPQWLCRSDLAAAGLSRCHSTSRHKRLAHLKSRAVIRRARRRAGTHTPRPHAVADDRRRGSQTCCTPETHLPRTQRACHGVEPGFGHGPGSWRTPQRARSCAQRRASTRSAQHTTYMHPPAHMHPSVTCTMLMFHAHGVRCPASVARLALSARPSQGLWCLLLSHADLIPHPIVARWSSASRHGAPRRTCAIVGTDGRRHCCCRRGSRGRGPRGSYPGVAHRKVHARHIQCLVHRVVDADDAEAAPSTISSVPEALAQHVDAVRVSGSHCWRRHYRRRRLFLRGPVRHHLQPAAQLAVLRLELRDLVLVLVLRLDGAAAAMPTAAAAAAARCGQPHRGEKAMGGWGGCVPMRGHAVVSE